MFFNQGKLYFFFIILIRKKTVRLKTGFKKREKKYNFRSLRIWQNNIPDAILQKITCKKIAKS